MYQLVPILMLAAVGVVFFLLRGKMGGMAKQMAAAQAASVDAVRAQFSASRQAGESEIVCVHAQTRTMLKATLFVVGVTNHRLFLQQFGQPIRTFERRALSLQVHAQKWTDQGNMQVTYSEGWEAKVTLPGGESHVWRIYEQPGVAEWLRLASPPS